MLNVFAANTYAGPTTIQAGQLLRSGAEKLPDTTLLTIGTGLTFSLQNFSETVGAIAGPGSIALGNALLTIGDGMGSSFGGVVLQALLDKASSRGDSEVELHAQTSAEGFYAKFGFMPVGEIYAEAGIEHITMRKRLA